MKKLCTLFLVLLHCVLFSNGQELPYKAPDFPKSWSQPGILPDRIILTFSDDPATTQSVTWRTDTSVKTAYAEIAYADAAPKFWRNGKSIIANTSMLDASKIHTANVVANYHSVTFAGLTPDTTYAYRVGDGKHWSEWFHFRTASKTNKPFSFLYLGDAQNFIFELWSRLIRGAVLKAPDARFIIHAGDLVSDGHADKQWHEWFVAGGWLHAMIPSIPTPRQSRIQAIL